MPLANPVKLIDGTVCATALPHASVRFFHLVRTTTCDERTVDTINGTSTHAHTSAHTLACARIPGPGVIRCAERQKLTGTKKQKQYISVNKVSVVRYVSGCVYLEDAGHPRTRNACDLGIHG